jgi:phosphoribosylglycinamide formyltransferase-1
LARLRVAVLISGRGSNLQALIEACAKPDFPAEIIQVISNRPEAAGVERARQAGIASKIISHRHYSDRVAFDAALDAALRDSGAQLVCLAGFMRLLTPGFVDAWRDRLVNVHPSLLPSFKGLDTHARALAAGVRFHGCTVHFVRPEMDEGPIVAQAVVPVLPDDNADRLAMRVLAAEHRLYPSALRLIAEGKVRVEAGRTIVDAPRPSEDVLLNPA